MAKLSDVMTNIEYKYEYSTDPQALDEQLIKEGINWQDHCSIELVDPKELNLSAAEERRAARFAQKGLDRVPPITVIRTASGLQIIDGKNRALAAKLLGEQAAAVVISDTIYNHLKLVGVKPEYFAYNKLKSVEIP